MTESREFTTWGRQWQHKLRVADVFRNEDLTFEQRRDEVVKRIKAAPFYNEDDEELYLLVDELADSDSEDWFDAVWNGFYDWCDMDNRVWVEVYAA